MSYRREVRRNWKLWRTIRGKRRETGNAGNSMWSKLSALARWRLNQGWPRKKRVIRASNRCKLISSGWLSERERFGSVSCESFLELLLVRTWRDELKGFLTTVTHMWMRQSHDVCHAYAANLFFNQSSYRKLLGVPFPATISYNPKIKRDVSHTLFTLFCGENVMSSCIRI